MPRPTTDGALVHLRILDLSQVRAGPTCVRQFADFGADVIKIEAPPASARPELATGPRLGADMQNLHRNKRTLTLNLKSDGGLRVFRKLVETADVVVENFRPDVKHRLGIDYERLAAINPRIILASISGFGQDGPYRDRPGFDQIAQGMSGLMSVTGHPGGPPTRAGAAVVDMAAGLFAALGIMTALLERERSGRGQWVQSSLLHAGVALMDFQAARHLIGGEVPRPMGNDHPTSMPTSAYPTSDGYINVAATGSQMWQRLCATLEREDLLAREEFADEQGRSSNRAALNAELSDALRARTSEDWIARLNAAGIPCGPIYTMDQVFADEQVRHLGIATPISHPKLGEIEVIANAARLTRTPSQVAAPLPDPGEHNDEILREIGYDDAQIAALRAEGAI
ncbi:MAG: CoA transferase [Burkholderiales bacterium]|nr:CoA transferase [Burkholderiales bacterium]